MIAADEVFVVSACETAVTVTVAGLGTAFGAVYSPPEEIVPVELLPPVTPFTCQVTAVSEVPVTVAENCRVDPTLTVFEGAEMVIETVWLDYRQLHLDLERLAGAGRVPGILLQIAFARTGCSASRREPRLPVDLHC